MRPPGRPGLRSSLLGLVTALALAGPVPSHAQVLDPCKPVPIPELCPSPQPQPSLIPLPGGPNPSPSPKPEGKGKGKGGGTSPSPGAPAPEASPPRVVPFAISGPNSSARVITLLSGLIPRGMPLEESLLRVMGPFPVAGPAWWINDWHAPRSGGRVHQGLDIFAPAGTPLVAAASGFLSQKGVGGLCGIYVEITDAQGVQYFYCHMSAHAPGLQVGQPIEVGQVVGYVGNTGNAINTPSHVHFEFQPGGVPHPPKPWVDRWVRIAEERAADLVRGMGGAIPPAAGATPAATAFRLTRTFDLTGGADGGNPQRTAVILPGLQPGLSSLQIASDAVDQMAWEIDWGGAASAQLDELVRRYRSQVVSEALAGLGPWPFAEQSVSQQATTVDGSD